MENGCSNLAKLESRLPNVPAHHHFLRPSWFGLAAKRTSPNFHYFIEGALCWNTSAQKINPFVITKWIKATHSKDVWNSKWYSGISFGVIKSWRDAAWRGGHLLGLLLSLGSKRALLQLHEGSDLSPAGFSLKSLHTVHVWSCVESLLTRKSWLPSLGQSISVFWKLTSKI